MTEQTWNLTPLYADTAAWEQDYNRIQPLAERFAGFRGKLADSAETLRDAIAALDDFERLGEKVYVYAHLRADENTADNANQAAQERVESLFARLSEITAWFEPEVMAIPDGRMQVLLDSPELAFYRNSLLELLREKPHTLSEPEERLLGVCSDVLGASDKTYSMLNDADLDFGTISCGGKKVAVTHGNYRRFLENPDRRVRLRAFRAMFGAYAKLRNTFASTLDGEIKRHVVSAQIRHYDSSLQAALFDDEVPEQVYRNLISTVHGHLGGLYRYLDLRRRVLRLRKLDMYDLFVPLADTGKSVYSWAEARTLVSAALAPLGEDYVRDSQQAYSQRWVDVPERKGKRSGAYSSGCYDSYPYMLLNFNSTLDDVFTLAHELGHSMHSFYSHRAQPYHYAEYSIFVAEVASTTNELLLSEYLLDSNPDPAFQIRLLSHLLDEIRGTIYRQTMFAEFELMIHELAESGTPLTADVLSAKYEKLNRKYHGSAIDPDSLIANEWARIPHFYYDFYVYKYATGMSAAIQLAQNLRSGDPAKREAYLGFLRAGGSKPVLDILRDAGVDLSTPAPVAAALDYFENITGRLATLLGK